jgi:hypothetical protein
MQNPKSNFKPIVLIFWSLWILWGFGYQTLWLRLTTECQGTIVSSQNIPPSRGPRYVTQYTLNGLDGQTSEYIAGPTDASLPRSMPVGTHIRKERWHLSYERDGQRVDNFSVLFYAGILTIAVACLSWGIHGWREQSEAAQ